MDEKDSVARIRAEFNALKAKLKASAEELDPERYDRVTAAILAFDETVIRQQIKQRYGSVRIARMMQDIERRLDAAEERERERT